MVVLLGRGVLCVVILCCSVAARQEWQRWPKHDWQILLLPSFSAFGHQQSALTFKIILLVITFEQNKSLLIYPFFSLQFMSMDIKYSWSNIQDVNPSHDKVLFCFGNYSSSSFFTRIGEGIKVQGQIQGHKWTIWYMSKYWFMSILIWWRSRPIGKKRMITVWLEASALTPCPESGSVSTKCP